MTFNPQYSTWAIDDLSVSTDAVYNHSGEFEIYNGVAKLFPITFSGYSYGMPWDHVSGWNINNTLDTQTLVSARFSLVSTTGWNSTLSGTYGNTGLYSQVAFYTEVDAPTTGSNGLYGQGSHSAIVRNTFNDINNGQFTLEFSTRSLVDNISHALNTGTSTGVSCQGVYIGTSGGYSFIEIHPSGLKIHGPEAAILPLDINTRLRTFRCTLNNDDITIVADDGNSLFAANALTPHSFTSQYIAFGAPPFMSGASFTGTSGHFHNQSGLMWDPYGISGIAGYEGTILWDDIKLLFNEATIVYPSGMPLRWPTDTKTLYTAPWYPSESMQSYLGAFVDAIPYNGGTTTVAVQSTNTTGWVDSGAATLTFSGASYHSKYIDLSAVPLYAGTSNALRFRISTTSTGGAPPEIDKITVIGKPNDALVDIHPNWKLSSLPKNIIFSVDMDKYHKMIPPSNYQDDIYLHNEAGIGSIATLDNVPSAEPYMLTGSVKTSYGGIGLVKIDDGVYGSAWRNYNYITGYTGSFSPISYSPIFSGLLAETGNPFYGEILDIYHPFPKKDQLYTGLSGAVVSLSVEQYYDIDNVAYYAQRVVVDNWTGTSGNVGIYMSGISAPIGSNYIGLIEGVIHIPRGPGVRVMMQDGYHRNDYFLDGWNYREPKKFSCAVRYTGDVSTGSWVAIGAAPRANFSELNTAKWGEWSDDIKAHDVDEFILYSITGSIVDHSYVQYTGIANEKRYAGELDDLSIYNSIDYVRPDRGSVIFEGWIRPHGVLTNESLVAYSQSSDGRGVNLYLSRTGELRATYDLNVHAPAMGMTGDQYITAGLRSNRTIVTGISTSATLYGSNNPISWGNWNHFGIYQDVRAIGDTYSAADQPMIASGFEITHGARSAKLYLELNGNIIDSLDIGVDAYGSRTLAANSVTPSFPTTTTYINTWPKMPVAATTGDTRTITIGQDLVCDFDHIRFGIRDRVDARVESNVYGAKISPPWFSSYNSIKPLIPTSGTYEHMQWAHVLRLDHPTDYVLWDDGFAVDHALAINYTVENDLTSRGIKTSKMFIETVSDGPKNQQALRLGPGQNIVIPFSTYDERIFNGTGSMSLLQYNVSNSSGRYYSNTSTFVHPNLDSWFTGVGEEYYLTNSNSHFVAGGFFRLNNLPTGATQIGDLFSMEETMPSVYTTASQGQYGAASAYVGVNSGGQLVYGTRRNKSANGNVTNTVVGPFTGNTLSINNWYAIGLDAKLGQGTGYMNLYLSGTPIVQKTVYLSEIGATGVSGHLSGRAMGYQGLLGGSLNNIAYKNSFIFGGEHARTNAPSSEMYRELDVDLSEIFVGFPLSGYTWPWERLAHTGQSGFSGHTDVGVKNQDTKIGYIVGSGTVQEQPLNGVMMYPATDYTDAGTHLLYGGALGNNDFEGLNKAGIKLFDEAIFLNAQSYYVTYQNDTAAKALGTVDSPIQLGVKVPDEGVNLALISNKEWTSESATTTFDMSDQNYSNITNKVHGDYTVSRLINNSGRCYTASGQLDSSDIRVTSLNVWDEDSGFSAPAYFMHLIGGEEKMVYISSALDHTDVTGDETLFYSNLNKIKSSITVKDSNGNPISFEEFPYSLIVSPYNIASDISTGNFNSNGFGANFNANLALPDKNFTCILVANSQTIGRSVFINYPSSNYFGNSINLQDSEVYNPIPVFNKLDPSSVYNSAGSFIAPSGSFSVTLDPNLNSYSVSFWNANLTGWI